MNFGKPKGFEKKLKESRKANRYPVEADVTILMGDVQYQMKSLDVSAGGLLLKTNLPEDLVGETLEVTLKYSTSQQTVLTATGKCRLVPKALNRLELIEPKNGFQNLLDAIWG